MTTFPLKSLLLIALNAEIFKVDVFNMVSFQARHIYICEHHKNMIQSVRSKRKRKDSDDETEMSEVRECFLHFLVFKNFSKNLCYLFDFLNFLLRRKVQV